MRKKFIDVTGKNEEEAIGKALRQLNLERDDVSVEILERAKSGFLGIGSCPAKIRVYYGAEEPALEVIAELKEGPEELEKSEVETSEIKSEPVSEMPEELEKPEKTENLENLENLGNLEKTNSALQISEANADPEPDSNSGESSDKLVEIPENPEKKTKNKGKNKNKNKTENKIEREEIDDEKAQAVKTFLTGLLERLDSPAEIHVYLSDRGHYQVILEGPGMGALIGRRGETLDAIQQLTNYAVNRNSSGRARIHLDAEGYREKREQSLRNLARKVAAKVVRYRRSVTLEPMNAYERHVIHTALQDVPDVTTHSTGTEPNRRVIVSYDYDWDAGETFSPQS